MNGKGDTRGRCLATDREQSCALNRKSAWQAKQGTDITPPALAISRDMDSRIRSRS